MVHPIVCGLFVSSMFASGLLADERQVFSARASEIDPRCKAYPELGFLLEDKKGKPADRQVASVDRSVTSRGRLVIWLMAPNDAFFERLNAYGLHVIQPHYARHWFGLKCQQNPVGEHCRGNLRLEAATGEDFSDEAEIAKPDGMMERSHQFVRWLAKKDPDGGWEQFLGAEGLDWEKVIVAGCSHGSTTAARFAKHVKVARVVGFSGPRDQFQAWQSLPSSTPENRYFMFTHVLDDGWVGDHYCRSWQMLGLCEFGPIVNVETARPPFGHTRRLVTDFDVGGDAKLAHNAVLPRSKAKKTAAGEWGHDEVWRYLFTHPVDQVGDPVPPETDCELDLRNHPPKP